MSLEKLNAGKNSPKQMNAIIEVPENGYVKYEISKEYGLLRVDRILHTPMAYPANYGYFPGTLGDDGDPLGQDSQSQRYDQGTHPIHTGHLGHVGHLPSLALSSGPLATHRSTDGIPRLVVS